MPYVRACTTLGTVGVITCTTRPLFSVRFKGKKKKERKEGKEKESRSKFASHLGMEIVKGFEIVRFCSTLDLISSSCGVENSFITGGGRGVRYEFDY